MPWQSLAELKASEAFKRSETLRKMPEFRLRRFLEVFNRIYETKVGNGASHEEAESAAFAMAYSAARRYTATPMGSSVEAALHYATPLMPLQFSMGGEVEDLSFEFLESNIGIINAAVAGNAINLDHEHHEPVGVLRRLLLPREVPKEVRANMKTNAPFVAEYSYYSDTPEDLRGIRTISAEWLKMARKDGRDEVILPDSFAFTENPASDQSLGVGVIAKTAPKASAKPYEGKGIGKGQGKTMPDEATEHPDLVAKVATLSTNLDAEKQARVAAEAKATALETKYASLKEQNDKNTRVLEEMKAAALDKEAEDWAKALADAGKIATDAEAGAAADYKKYGKEAAEAFFARVPVQTIGVAAAKANATKPQQLSTEQEKEWKARMAAALQVPVSGGDFA